MLHMVLISHGPDTCAAVHKEAGEMARTAASQIAETSKTNNVSVQGWWVDPPGHVFFMLVDAPSAHAVNSLMQELKLFLWNTIDIHPVITMDEAMPLAAR
jgi:muconolactone delta-isomerase